MGTPRVVAKEVCPAAFNRLIVKPAGRLSRRVPDQDGAVTAGGGEAPVVAAEGQGVNGRQVAP